MNAFAHLHTAALSDVGKKRRNNEDSFGCFPAVGVFCVADGMGGGDDGEIASGATVQSVERIVPDLVPPAGAAFSSRCVADAVIQSVNRASRWIFRRAQAKRLKGCGSTFVGLCLDASNPHVAVAVHAGDSRLYRLRDGGIRQLTSDHSAASLMGARNDAEVNPMFRSMVLRAVGIACEVDVERTPVEVAAGDRFLLCSDGLSRMVPDGRLLQIGMANERAEDAALAFVAAANDAGGLDNVTVIVVDVGPLPDSLPETPGPHMAVAPAEFFGEAYPEPPDGGEADSSSEDDIMGCSASVDGVGALGGARVGWRTRIADGLRRWWRTR